jgi:hypothetical protein
VGLRYLLIILHSRMGNMGIYLRTVGMNMQYLVSRDRLRKRWLDNLFYIRISQPHTHRAADEIVCVFPYVTYILSLSPALSVGGDAVGARN